MSDDEREDGAGRRWQEAIELGARLGILEAEAANCALERLRETPPGDLTSALIASWIDAPSPVVEGLLRLSDQESERPGSRGEALRSLADSLLGSPPTVRGADLAHVLPTQEFAHQDARTPSSQAGTWRGASPAGAGHPPAWRANFPRRLGPYELQEELGHGGMGIVFRARHESLGTLCAVKVLIAGEHASPEEISRFQLEARAIARMGKHPNIVSVHDLGMQGNLTYYTMELVEGKPLSALIREREFLAEESASLVEKVARAIHFAHEKGILHRDLKPENVVVRSDGEPQVMDFGLARDVTSTVRQSLPGQMMGSPNYMAPEQARGEVDAIDRRTDVYGLGTILYEMLCGLPPHPGRVLAQVIAHIVGGEVTWPRRIRPDTPRDLETVCLKCLETVPGKRYPTAEALADDLARFQRREPIQARPAGRMERFVRRVRKHPVSWGLLALTVLLLGAQAWRSWGPARIDLSVDPSEARVERLDGRLLGRGWVWPAGRVFVRVSAPGYETSTAEVDAPPGTFRTHTRVALVKDHGFLSMESDPPGAEVLLGERAIGTTTPAERVKLPTGTYKLSLLLAHYERYTTVATIAPGETLALGKVRLTHEAGVLALTGNPAGMSAIVRPASGRGEGTRLSPPVTVSLDAGVYRLEGVCEGYFDRNRDVEILPGGQTGVNLSLNRQVLWVCETRGEVRSSPALADLDGDGVLDCVVGSTDGKLYALSGDDGAPLWTYETERGIESSVSLGDLNLDGVLDCVIGSDDHRAYALNGRDGSVLWSHATGGEVTGAAALADLDGDRVPDCVVGSHDGNVYAISGKDGAALWVFQAGGAVQSSAAVGDLDKDGQPDCVFGSNDHRIYAVTGRGGTLLWSHETGGAVRSSPALGDLDRNGTLDCVVGSDDRSVYALSGTNGAVMWSCETQAGVWSSPALADLNADGAPDCVVGSDDCTVYALSGIDGARLWSRETGGAVESSAALGDLDEDGTLDCVVGSLDGLVYALSGRNGAVLWTYDTGGGVVSSPSLGDLDGNGELDCVVGSASRRVHALCARDGPALWSHETAGKVESTPALCDLNGDGVLDCVAGSLDGLVYALSGMDGAVLWEYATGGPVRSSPSLGDLNGDGTPDCVIGSDDRKVHALSGRDGSPLWSFGTQGWIRGRPALGDMDGDGVLDCVVGSSDGRVYAISGGDGAALWTFGTGGSVESSPALGDLDGDGVFDCVVGSWDRSLYALSGKGGKELWRCVTGGVIRSSPALADLDGDGVPDAVVGSFDGTVRAVSGRNGAPLWTRVVGGEVESSPSLGDLDRDGTPDCIVGSWDDRVVALSGRDGSEQWSFRTGGDIHSAPAMRDLDLDGVLDCIVPSMDQSVYALSGRDGSVIWRHRTARGFASSPTLGDLNGDGVIECVIGSNDRRVIAIPMRPRDVLFGWERGCSVSASALTRYGRLCREGSWRVLEERAGVRAKGAADPWVRAVSWLHLGLTRLRLLRPTEAMDAFIEARRLGLQSPEGAVSEWVASWRWAECHADRRAEARSALIEAFDVDPDAVFDGFVESRDLLPPAAVADLCELVQKGPLPERAQVVRALLAVLPLADGTRPCVPKDAERLLAAAERLVSVRIRTAEGSVARSFGYLALLADAQGDPDHFRRFHALCLEFRHRPISLDRLLSETSRER